jgi:hypothetical protein
MVFMCPVLDNQYHWLVAARGCRMRKVSCFSCAGEIPVERLEALPNTIYCVRCAEKKVVRKEVEVLKSSATGRNGFAAND